MKNEDIKELRSSLRRRITEVQRDIKAACCRVPERVVNGSVQTAAAWKYAANKAMTSKAVNSEPGSTLRTSALQQRLFDLQILKEKLT